MDREILNVTQRALLDTSIINAEKHTHMPYSNTTFGKNDVIRIPIENEDVYTFPGDSIINIDGDMRKPDGTPTTANFINNGIMFLFDEIRYELGGKAIDRVRNPGITTTMKNYLSYGFGESRRFHNAGWSPLAVNTIVDAHGHFNVCIPLRLVLGFAEDYRKILLNVKQELILVRSSSDDAVSTEKVKITLNQVSWRVPHISVADAERLKLLKHLQRNVTMEINFRSWELHEYPELHQTHTHTWAVKTTSQLEKPRFVIVGVHTDTSRTHGRSQFDHCQLINMKLHLGSAMYPYDNLNLDFTANRYSLLYEMYANFQQSYYGSVGEPILVPSEFKEKAPLVVIDCSHQNEIVKVGAVDVRLEFQTKEALKAKTTAYCLILHDRVVRYNPTTNIVQDV